MELATQSWFEGWWSIRRTIDDRRSGNPGRLTGWAVFKPDNDGLAYREEGVLEMNGRALPAERRYRWRFEPGGRIRVYFDDWSPFHSFIPGNPVSDHLCGEDRYAVEYEFLPESWRTVWEVKGPLKDYVMETWYSRDEDRV